MIEVGDGWRDGACHCGTVRFRVRLQDGLRAARRCSCSLCAMRGAIALTARLDGLEVLQGADALGTYQFNTHVAEHHFCVRCGIYTHHRRRSNPDQYGVNAACLGLSPFGFADVPVMDGVNHPADMSGSGRCTGVLSFRAE